MQDTVIVSAKCPGCGSVETFEIPRSGFDLRSRGANLIKAFPDLSTERILQLAHHKCARCQPKDPKLVKLAETVRREKEKANV